MSDIPRSMHQYKDEDLADLVKLIAFSKGKPELIAAVLSEKPDRFDDLFQDFDVIYVELAVDKPPNSIGQDEFIEHVRRLEILRLELEVQSIGRLDEIGQIDDEDWHPYFPGVEAVFVKANGDEILVYCHVTEFVKGTRKNWIAMRT